MISIVTGRDPVIRSDRGELSTAGPHSPRAALRLIGGAEMSTVLIVDDCPAVRKTLHSLLETELSLVVCIEAVNGLDAIAKAKISCPDLIILDLSMPEMNGFDAATVLQRTMPQVPLFMFTSHDTRDVESQAASVGIRAVFSKYAGINALVAEASELLSPAHTLA
jgi:DNA-binding NarL/FixJ family response regulator